MGYVFKKSDGTKLEIDEKVFWDGLKNDGQSLEKLLAQIASEPISTIRNKMLSYLDQMSFQDSRAWFYPFASGHSGDKKDYLKNPVALRMFKMLRSFFREQKYSPYFLKRIGVKTVQEHITGMPKKTAAEIKQEKINAGIEKLHAKEKLPRKIKKELTRELSERMTVKKR